MKKKLSCAMLSLLALACPSLMAQPGQSFADVGMKLFLGVCVLAKGDLTRMEAAANVAGLQELPADEARRFVRNGKAWSTGTKDAPLTIAARPPNTCSVFLQSAGREEIRSAVKFCLPPPDSPFKARQIEDSLEDGVNTVSYLITLHDKPFAAWMLRSFDTGTAVVSVRTMP